MRVSSKTTVAAIAAVCAFTIGISSDAAAQVRSEQPVPVRKDIPDRVDTLTVRRVDTVTVVRRDTIVVTRTDTVRAEPLPIALPRMFGSGWYWGLGGGLSSPRGDFANYENGWNLTAMMGWDPVASPLGVRFDASYENWGERAATAGLSADPTVFTVNGDLKLRLPVLPTTGRGRNSIYGLGGLTYARYKDVVLGSRYDGPPVTTPPTGITVDNSWSDSWGWNAGGGVSFGLGRRMDLFVESRLVSFGGNKSYVPVVVGLTF
jgi:opacity protein-like surface antigen